jgi:hypothetical protein
MKPTRLTIKITLLERIDEHWSIWFDGLTILPINESETQISGEILDRAAVHGYLERIRDLNLKFSSIIVEEK